MQALFQDPVNRDLTLELDISASKDDRKTAKFKFKADSIAVGGSSGGGLCAYLAAVHCRNPKPVAILSIYGMGGDFFVSVKLHLRNPS